MYQLHEGSTTVPLSREEAQVLIRGEIPPVLARTLAERGVAMPPRGTRPFTLMIQRGLSWRETTCYARIARRAA